MSLRRSAIGAVAGSEGQSNSGTSIVYNWGQSASIPRVWAEDSIRELVLLFRLCSFPVRFAVPCAKHIDPATLGDVASEINKELLVYVQRVKGWEVFSGDPRKKITREGTQYARMTPEEREATTPKPKTRFITISEEVKQTKCSEISWMATEVLLVIASLYREAFEIQLLVEEAQSLIPQVQLPINHTDPATMAEFAEKWTALTTAFQAKLDGWISRNPNILDKPNDGFVGNVKSMEVCIASRSYTRYGGLLVATHRSLRTRMEEHGRQRPLYLCSPKDVIRCKRKDPRCPLDDFSPPLGMSLFELAYNRMRNGQGLPRFGKIIEEMRAHSIATDLDKRLGDMMGKIVKTVSDSLYAAIQEIPRNNIGSIQLSPEFLKRVGVVIANSFFDFVLCCFNYAVVNTDASSGTTIHLRALKNIYMLQQCDGFMPVTPEVIMFISALCINAATH